MDIEKTIAAGCEGVRNAYRENLLRSRDLFGFSFTKAVNALPTKCSSYLDFRPIHSVEHQPNFFITDNEDQPKIIFIGKLRYCPTSCPDIETDLNELVRHIKKPEVIILMDANDWNGTEVPVSSEVRFGYFVLTEIGATEIECVIEESIPHSDQSKFHYAIGALPSLQLSPDISTYFLPQKMDC